MTETLTPPVKQDENRNADGTFKEGVSGNPAGRPKGKTLKEFVREQLFNMSDEEKKEFLKQLPADLKWKMAEGNPANESKIDLTPETIKAINYVVPAGAAPNPENGNNP